MKHYLVIGRSAYSPRYEIMHRAENIEQAKNMASFFNDKFPHILFNVYKRVEAQ